LCSFTRANIVFLISSSSSICNSQNSCTQWSLELSFVSNIINAFNIGTNNVRVGLVTYSATVNSRFNMNQYTDKNSLINGVSSQQYTPGGNGPIDFAGGLREARTSQFTLARGLRLGAANVLIVLTNGESSVTNAAAVSELNLIRAAGILVIPVGLSATATNQVVSSLVVPPPPFLNWNFFLNAAINQNLQSLASPVSTQVCLVASSNCLSQVMDIVFVAPATMSVFRAGGNNPSYWSNMMNFVGDLVQEMNIGNVRVGLVAYGDFPVTLISLNNQLDANSMAGLIRSQQFQNLSFGNNIQSAINTVRTQLFSGSSGARSGVPQVMVLITDSPSSSNTLTTLAEANAAIQQGIRIFTIGATSNVNVTELQLLSSQPRLLTHQWFQVSSLDYSSQLQPLEYIVLTELCRPYYDVNCGYTTYGGYQCFCQWGSCDVRPMNGTTCIDVNECNTNNGGCAQQCSNSAGSFACSCGTGFQLAQDQRTCIDINECNSGGSGSAGPCIGNALCINTYGNFYCLSNTALVAALHGEAPASFNEPLMAAFPGTVIGLSAALAVTTTILIAVVAGFIRYAIRRGRRDSEDESDLIADVSD